MQFDHIYIETDIAEHPVTRSILEKQKNPSIIPITNYKQLFNRKKQNFNVQRKQRRLILAKQKYRFSFLGNERVRSFGSKHIYSCTMIRNCPYFCEYCFLSGMHESAHIVIYVNIEDYRKEVKKLSDTLLQTHPNDSIYLISSYLSDLPALESVYPFCKTWMQIVQDLPNTELEIRTKSDCYAHLRKMQACSNTILVWSLSPQAVINKFEHGTASFHTRVFQIRAAIEDGWRVRVCFDPVIYVPDWKKIYARSLRQLLQHCPAHTIEALSYGSFRMGAQHLQKMKKLRPEQGLLHTLRIQNSLASYDETIVQEIKAEFHALCLEYFPAEKIFFVHG